MSETLRYLAYWVERLKSRPRIALTPWTTWTPTITQSGSVTHTAPYARYMVIEKLALVQAVLLVTGTGTAGNAIIVGGIPAVIAPANTGDTPTVGTAFLGDANVGGYVAAVRIISSSSVRFDAEGVPSGGHGASPSWALANNDFIRFTAQWEIS